MTIIVTAPSLIGGLIPSAPIPIDDISNSQLLLSQKYLYKSNVEMLGFQSAEDLVSSSHQTSQEDEKKRREEEFDKSAIAENEQTASGSPNPDS
ncbi:hypothetical protein [Calothrix sp. NIES-2098]|uniref:hypothetical protein n=1 Tax=Calothrix sp. NIES-2098 TaxID=1954171 RepID=UPI000B60653D|nr:hypothetical protein NIES2098_20660 [Calothrix sp. NIES-2098]